MKTSGPAGAANTTSSASIGIGFMLGGVQNGFTLQAGASSGRGKADGQDQTHLNTKIRTSPSFRVKCFASARGMERYCYSP
jgi:hypothetical protein